MSADKRSVHTDALATLGTLDLREDAGRDAIHIAVEPMIANETLKPGEHIGVINGRASASAKELFGIVDPFLGKKVFEGERFWMLIYPRKINSLRHVWNWDEFDRAYESSKIAHQVANVLLNDKKVSEEFIENWLKHNPDAPDYNRLLVAAEDYSEGDYSICIVGTESSGEIPEELWHHIQIVLGTKFKSRPEYFSCSC